MDKMYKINGNPEEFAKYYYQQGADELIYQDVVVNDLIIIKLIWCDFGAARGV